MNTVPIDILKVITANLDVPDALNLGKTCVCFKRITNEYLIKVEHFITRHKVVINGRTITTIYYTNIYDAGFLVIWREIHNPNRKPVSDRFSCISVHKKQLAYRCDIGLSSTTSIYTDFDEMNPKNITLRLNTNNNIIQNMIVDDWYALAEITNINDVKDRFNNIDLSERTEIGFDHILIRKLLDIYEMLFSSSSELSYDSLANQMITNSSLFADKLLPTDKYKLKGDRYTIWIEFKDDDMDPEDTNTITLLTSYIRGKIKLASRRR